MLTSSDPDEPVSLITPQQVARRLSQRGISIGAGAIRRWARTHRVPCWRSPTGRFLIDADIIQRLLSAYPNPEDDSMP
jgi:hypothetical protein